MPDVNNQQTDKRENICLTLDTNVKCGEKSETLRALLNQVRIFM